MQLKMKKKIYNTFQTLKNKDKNETFDEKQQAPRNQGHRIPKDKHIIKKTISPSPAFAT